MLHDEFDVSQTRVELVARSACIRGVEVLVEVLFGVHISMCVDCVVCAHMPAAAGMWVAESLKSSVYAAGIWSAARGIHTPLARVPLAPRAALKAAYEAAEAAFKEVRETADWRCVNVMLATRGGAKAPKAAAAFEAAKADEIAAKAAAEEVGELFRAHASGPDVWADNTALMISRAHRAAIAREGELERNPEGLWEGVEVCKADAAAIAARKGH